MINQTILNIISIHHKLIVFVCLLLFFFCFKMKSFCYSFHTFWSIVPLNRNLSVSKWYIYYLVVVVFFYCNDFINITLNIHIKSCQYMCLMCGRSTVMENGWRMKVSFYGMEHQRSKSELFNRFSSHQLWMGFKIAINLYPNLVFPHW